MNRALRRLAEALFAFLLCAYPARFRTEFAGVDPALSLRGE